MTVDFGHEVFFQGLEVCLDIGQLGFVDGSIVWGEYLLANTARSGELLGDAHRVAMGGGGGSGGGDAEMERRVSITDTKSHRLVQKAKAL